MTKSAKITSRFGERVRQLRTSLGMSQESFASKCDLDRTYISGIERGIRNPALKNIEVIAKGLNTTVSKLMEKL